MPRAEQVDRRAVGTFGLGCRGQFPGVGIPDVWSALGLMHRAGRLVPPSPEQHLSVRQHARVNRYVRQLEDRIPPAPMRPYGILRKVSARRGHDGVSCRSADRTAVAKRQARTHQQHQGGASSCCECHVLLSTEPVRCGACCPHRYNAAPPLLVTPNGGFPVCRRGRRHDLASGMRALVGRVGARTRLIAIWPLSRGGSNVSSMSPAVSHLLLRSRQCHLTRAHLLV